MATNNIFAPDDKNWHALYMELLPLHWRQKLYG